ncbi:hypothetical protein H0R92_11460 [Treponema sp. OMZ 840]|uniref:acyl-[acyl-carrier-protein] thioesterase n=1 Tax=Treponema sp. OMZ 840 TaxID=244313 RepID=UPI003D94402A
MIIDNKYTIPYTIPSVYIDGKCRCTALAFVSLAQEMAALHYSSAGLSIPHLQQMDLTWVISKQHFEIYEYPLWLDEMILKTWAQPSKGLMCLRDFEYTYAKGGKKTSIDAAFAEKKEDSQSCAPPRLESESGAKACMRATSCWLILNSKTGRLVKPDEKTMGGLTFNDEHMEGDVLIKIELCENWDIEEHFSPTLLDIDLNSHVNNLNYVRWILSFMSASFCRGKLLRVLDTNFMSSAVYGEKLICRCKQIDEATCIHSIVREADGSDVFRARTEWADEKELSRELQVMA